MFGFGKKLRKDLPAIDISKLIKDLHEVTNDFTQVALERMGFLWMQEQR